MARGPSDLSMMTTRTITQSGARRRGDFHRDEPAVRTGRIALVFILFCCGFVAVLGRAFYLQVVEHARYLKVATRQTESSAVLNAKRGMVVDRHGDALAVTVDVDSIFAQPPHIKDVDTAARKLAPVLGLSVATLQRKLSSPQQFVYLARRVNSEVAERVEVLNLSGVGIQREPKRFYPNVSLAAHVLGFTDVAGLGRAGIERHMEEALRGQSYRVAGLRDALGNYVYREKYRPHSEREGATVALTIDRQIQYAAEEVLRETVESQRAKGAVALVMEAKTGEILALASFPRFNPNNLNQTKPEQHLNRAISAVYEPGSTLKIVTIAAALESNVIEANENIDCESGRFRIGGREIGDADHEYGVLSIGEIIKFSSNICAAKIGMRMGSAQLHDWLVRFGFGRKTGVELPGEVAGLLRDHATWRQIGLANIAFGQGIAVTPLQILQATGIIANGGRAIAPRILRSAAQLERSRTTDAVISAETAKHVTEMMVSVTEPGGTATAAAIPGYQVAGKTGTAQKIDPVTGAYSRSLHVASFVGFVPAQNPDLVALVVVDEPKGSPFGGVVAAPAFQQIAMAALSARKVFPDSPADRERMMALLQKLTLPPALVASVATASTAAPLDTPEFDQILAAAASPVAGNAIGNDLSLEAQALLGYKHKDSSANTMPDFSGLALYQAYQLARKIRCDPVVDGSGVVITQNPPSGQPLQPGTRCEFAMASR